jgi:DNA-binding CsgD family transcriptional regulator
MRKTTKGRKTPAALTRRLEAFEGLASAFADIAAEASAEEFCVFTAGPSLGQSRLVPAIDSEFPKVSRASKRFAAKAAASLGDRLRSSTRPFFWRPDRRSAPPRLHLADEADPLGHEGSGFALPLHAASGRNGLAVFIGEAPSLSDEMLIDFQLRCIRLFSTLVDISIALPRKVPAMSNRELDCLRLTADGKTSDEIAVLLHLSAHTANQYLTAAAQKLNAVNRAHAVSKALRLGLIS